MEVTVYFDNSTLLHFNTYVHSLALTRVLSLVYQLYCTHCQILFSHVHVLSRQNCPFLKIFGLTTHFFETLSLIKEIQYTKCPKLSHIDIFLFLGQVCLVEKAVQCPMHSQHSPGRFERELDVIHTHTYTHMYTHTHAHRHTLQLTAYSMHTHTIIYILIHIQENHYSP